MIKHWKQAAGTRAVAWLIAGCIALPLAAGCGSKGDQTSSAPTQTIAPAPTNTPGSAMTTPAQAPKPGMSNTKKAVIVLAGAALLYYLYKKHQAQQQAAGNAGAQGQLYQSRNGGIYYRDAQHRPVWVTAPAQQVQVPASDVQQYAPDYQQYQGRPVPPVPPGYRTQDATQFDPSLANGAAQ